jgi:undecaprenyl-diphosphatase
MPYSFDLLPPVLTLAQAAAQSAVSTDSGGGSLLAIVQGIVMGLVQGITEFLPISSTAHLIIFRDILGWKDNWSKEAIDGIQFGSVIAVLFYFWKDLSRILPGAWSAFRSSDWQREEWKVFIGIAIGTIPALAGGLLLKKLGVELESPQVIATMSVVMALLLGLAEKFGTRVREFSQLQVSDGILVGLGQMIALLPGASRSGSTLTAGLFLGLERATAARFSFLLGFPTLAIATLVQGKDALTIPNMMLPLIVGVISTFIFSYLSIAWLLKFLQRQSAWVFVWYRLGFAAFLFVAIAAGKLP